jgi:cysteine desulfurase
MQRQSSTRNSAIYLDYAATTPVDARVSAAMSPFWSDHFGNPGSLHRIGQVASGAVFDARRKIAAAIGASYKEVIFTGSATEANNLALRGVLKYAKIDTKTRYRVIISSIEHESVFETARELAQEGVEVVTIPVSREGVIDLTKLKAALHERTILVSVIFGSNEIGVIQPISDIRTIIENFKAEMAARRPNQALRSGTSRAAYPLFHTDAAQALQYVNCNVTTLGVDLMTLSSHKIYGPKGIGALYVRNSSPVAPLITGGGQEFGFRSGTENVPLIVGFGRAVEITEAVREREAVRVRLLRDQLFRGIVRIAKKTILNGPPLSPMHMRLPNNLNISLPGVDGGEFLIALDLQGISASQGSACRARSAAPSPVLKAIGRSSSEQQGAIRFTLGRATTAKNIETTLRVITHIMKKNYA